MTDGCNKSFWDTLLEVIPDSEADIKILVGEMKRTHTKPVEVKESLTLLFDYIADSAKPKSLWSEKACELLDQSIS